MKTTNDVQPFKKMKLKQLINANIKAMFRIVKYLSLRSGLLTVQDQMHPNNICLVQLHFKM